MADGCGNNTFLIKTCSPYFFAYTSKPVDSRFGLDKVMCTQGCAICIQGCVSAFLVCLNNRQLL
jgi:hypothetical protein